MDTTFVWDDNFITDLEGVDGQHHALVDLFNELSGALFRQGQGQDNDALLEDIYRRLLAYTEYHFAEEEELMQQHGLDERHMQPHRHLHQQFVEQVALLWRQRKSMADPGTTLVGFLTSWLGLHILGVDQSMARQICSIRGGLSPAQAFDQERRNNDNGTQALLKMIGKLYTALSLQNMQLAESICCWKNAWPNAPRSWPRPMCGWKPCRAPMACCRLPTAPTLRNAWCRPVPRPAAAAGPWGW
jgi:hemerythrin